MGHDFCVTIWVGLNPLRDVARTNGLPLPKRDDDDGVYYSLNANDVRQYNDLLDKFHEGKVTLTPRDYMVIYCVVEHAKQYIVEKVGEADAKFGMVPNGREWSIARKNFLREETRKYRLTIC